jgi:hypothetical protein
MTDLDRGMGNVPQPPEQEPRPGPEQRLESLRFFVQANAGYGVDEELPQSLLDWMQEAETQIANLRARLNDLPNTYARKGPVW